MSEKLSYIEAHCQESWGSHGTLGIKILIATDHEFSKAEQHALYQCQELLEAAVMKESIRLNPTSTERAKKQRAELLEAFTNGIFVEEIPNGYCDRWCCAHLPWFVVTTTRGRITIGWRKSVISISWEPRVAGKAEGLFPTEDVTKHEHTIHAWGPEKAREYVKVLEASA